MLGRYYNHPLVRARGFLYMHDTATAESNFPEALQQLDTLLVTPTTMLTVPPPNANIAVIGAGLPPLFNGTFDIPLTKHQGVSLEYGMRQMSRELCNTTIIDAANHPAGYDVDYWGAEACRDRQNRLVSPVIDYSDNVQFLGRRTLLCSNCTIYDAAARTDVYNTGKPRVVCLYHEFGLRKFVAWGLNGDISNTPVITGMPVTVPIENSSSGSAKGKASGEAVTLAVEGEPSPSPSPAPEPSPSPMVTHQDRRP